MIKWLKNLLKPKQVQTVPVATQHSDDIPEEVMIQGLLLNEDELLVYRDDNKQLHYFCTSPYDSGKKYKVLIYED